MTDKRIALVTGVSSGIGEATAKRLMAAGYRVYGTRRRRPQSGPSDYPLLTLDVTDDESVTAAVDELFRREGRLDLLVNNAGIGIAPAAAEESSINQARHILDTKFLGMVRMIRAVVPQMRRQGGGRIINIGSIIGIVPLPYVALYAASKHAVEGYSEALDHELRGFGIRVSVIEPAYTRTAFEANNLMPDSPLEAYAQIRSTLTKVMSQAMAKADAPEAVADVIVRAALSDRPERRYTAGKLAGRLAFLRRFAPASLVDKAVRNSLQLNSNPARGETHER